MLVSGSALRELLGTVPSGLCDADTAGTVLGAMKGFESATPTLGARLGVIGLEFRLNRDPMVDVSIPLARQERLHLAKFRYAGPCGVDEASQPAWRSVLSLCKWWNRTDAVLGADRLLWLEFDIDGSAPTVVPTPNVLVQFKAESKDALSRPRQDLYFHSLGRILCPGGVNRRAIEERFAECRKTLPRGAYVRSVGMFLGRGASGVRVCVAGSRRGIVSCLKSWGWCGSEALERYFGRCALGPAAPRTSPGSLRPAGRRCGPSGARPPARPTADARPGVPVAPRPCRPPRPVCRKTPPCRRCTPWRTQKPVLFATSPRSAGCA